MAPRRSAAARRQRSPGPARKLDDRTITYQVGLVAGYTSYIGLDIANRTVVVILQNSFNWDLRAGHLLLLRTTSQGEAVINR